MSWVLLSLAAWLVVSLPLAVVVGRAIYRADRQDRAAEPAAELVPVLQLVRGDATPSDPTGQPSPIPVARSPWDARGQVPGGSHAVPPGT